jgi:hypothetical protein
MRGLPKLNHPAFETAAIGLRAKGWTVYSPHEMDIEAGDDCSHLPVELHPHFKFEFLRRVAQRDVEVILKNLRAEEGDILVALPGWTDSVGADAESALARWVGLPVKELHEVW